MIILVAFLAAAFASLMVTPLVVRAAKVRGLFDVPRDDRRVHQVPVPRVGGVAVFGALVTGLLAATFAGGLQVTGSAAHPRFLEGVLLGGSLLFLAGLWDDLRGLRPAWKLAVQVLAASAAFALGFRIDVLGIGSSVVELGPLSLPLTVLWVVGVTNAFNLIDGLDGLATGIAGVALATILTVALALGNTEVALVSAALLGAVLGFLRYNFNPARIFLGDSGSLFVGFMLAVLSVHGSLKSATAVLAIIPLSVLALPLLDTTLAILRRWLRGVPLSDGDARHIHHRLLALGLTHRKVAVTLYVLASAVASLGLLIVFAPPTAVIGIAIGGGAVSFALLLYGMRQLNYHEFIEAGSVLASGIFRVRRVIQDQIHARELAEVIHRANSLHQLEQLLGSRAESFGFLGIELCRESSACRKQLAHSDGRLGRAWKIDYPVAARETISDDPFVLRIWCDTEQSYRPYGAERVARILAPAVETWLEDAELAERPARLPASLRAAAT